MPSPQLKPGDSFNPWRGTCGFSVPEVVGMDRALGDGPKRLYEKLVRFAGRDGHCYPAQQKLAEELGKNDRQIRSDLKALEKARLIAHQNRAGRRSNTYAFLWHESFDDYLRRQNSASVGEDLSGSPPPVNGLRGEELSGRIASSGRKDSGAEGYFRGILYKNSAQEFRKRGQLLTKVSLVVPWKLVGASTGARATNSFSDPQGCANPRRLRRPASSNSSSATRSRSAE